MDGASSRDPNSLRGLGDPEARAWHLRQIETFGGGARAPEVFLRREEEAMHGLEAAYWRWPPSFPPAGRLGPDAPEWLFVQGNPRVRGPSVAIVGTRKADLYGLAVARTLARIVSGAGVRVISGGAIGVDTEAHRGALEGPGGTLVVLAGGLGRPHPVSNRDLFRQVRWHPRGALVSEMPVRTAPIPAAFPRRNRLIAAMADAVVVIQAGLASGALQTARWARRIGVPVFAVPGDVWYERSLGCLDLLREGARPLASPADLAEIPSLRDLGALRWPEPGRRPAFLPRTWEGAPEEVFEGATDRREQTVLEGLSSGPRDVDALVASSGLTAGEVLAVLSLLEVRGLVRRLPGDGWVRA